LIYTKTPKFLFIFAVDGENALFIGHLLGSVLTWLVSSLQVIQSIQILFTIYCCCIKWVRDVILPGDT
jgi:hypothetical protein